MLRRLTRTLFVKERCPVCQHRFRLWQTPWRCNNKDSCKQEKDERLAKFWGDSTPTGLVVAPPGVFQRFPKCHHCGAEARFVRLCPNCHYGLPFHFDESRNLSFAIVGAKEVGKSHYIAVLVDHWQKRLGYATGTLLEAVGDETRNRYREVFSEPIFKHKQTIDPTRSALGIMKNRQPLHFTLTVGRRNRHGDVKKSLLGKPKTAEVNLAFYDSAGEDLKSSDVMDNVNKYIYSADGIVLLLDPLQLPTVRDQLGSSIPLPAKNTETVDILGRIAELIRNGRKMPRARMIDVPLAVALSKVDALEPLIEQHYSVLAEPDHTRGFDVADSEAVSAEIEALIALWDGQHLLDQVRNNFRHYRFFGFSALGCNPQADRRIPHVIPRRVEDPFFWLLHVHGLIKPHKRN